MENRESPAFASLWTSAIEQVGGEPSNEAIKLAFDLLKDLSLDEIHRAIGVHCAGSKSHTRITPGDVREIVEGSCEAQAERAWSRLESAVRGVGPWKSVAFDDPILQGVVHEMGGWVKMGEITEHDWKFRRQEFVRRYSDYVKRRAHPGETGLLHGLHGDDTPDGEQIVLLGDQQRARAIAALPVHGERRSTVSLADLRQESGPDQLSGPQP